MPGSAPISCQVESDGSGTLGNSESQRGLIAPAHTHRENDLRYIDLIRDRGLPTDFNLLPRDDVTMPPNVYP